MAVISSRKIVELAQAADPKSALINGVGDISKVQIFGHNLLVGTYIRPEKTKGGVLRPEENIREDEFQGNIGLVLKLGEDFYSTQDGSAAEVGDTFVADGPLHEWVLFGYNDGLRFRYNDVPCRIISIERIRAIVPDPTKVL